MTSPLCPLSNIIEHLDGGLAINNRRSEDEEENETIFRMWIGAKPIRPRDTSSPVAVGINLDTSPRVNHPNVFSTHRLENFQVTTSDG